jgi:hypothetical protein
MGRYVPGVRTKPSLKRDLKGRKPSAPLNTETHPLLVRLKDGLVYQLPQMAAESLLRRRLATVALGVPADVILTEEEFDHAITQA